MEAAVALMEAVAVARAAARAAEANQADACEVVMRALPSASELLSLLRTTTEREQRLRALSAAQEKQRQEQELLEEERLEQTAASYKLDEPDDDEYLIPRDHYQAEIPQQPDHLETELEMMHGTLRDAAVQVVTQIQQLPHDVFTILFHSTTWT